MTVNPEDPVSPRSGPLNILAVALDSVADALVWTDSQSRIVGCNAAFEKLVGQSRDGLTQRLLPEVLPLQPPCQVNRPPAYPTHLILQGCYTATEYALRQGKQLRFLEILGQRMGDGEGAVAILTLRDVTRAKAADQTRAETLSLLQATLESTADGVFVVARSGQVLAYNQKFVRMWNMPEHLLTETANPRERFQYLADQTLDPEGFKARVLYLFDQTPEAAVFDRLLMKDGRIFERYSQPQWMEGAIVGRIWSYRDITERQQAELALQQREEKYRAIFENSQVGIGRTRLQDGLILEANQRFSQIMGYNSPAELIGQVRTQDFYAHVRDREHLLAELQRHGGVHDFEVQLIRRDGSLLWGLLSLRTNLAEDCLEFVITDISDRKRVEEERQRAEAALRQREAEYRLLVETANSVILKWDTQGTVLYLNDYGQKFFGYDLTEIVGHNVIGTIVPETETTGRDLEDLMAHLCQHPERYMFNENENCCKDGRRVWIAWANKPIYDEQEQLVGILSIGADVTERRRLEETLRQSQQFLNMIVENIPITVFTKNIQAGFRYELINQNCERILGFTLQEGLGKTDYDLLPQALADHYRAQDLSVVAQGKAVETSEAVTLPHSGEQVFLRSVKLPLYDSQGQPSYLLGISEDFTERQQREKELRDSEERFRTLIANLPGVVYRCHDDENWTLTFLSESFEHITGYPVADFIGNRMRNINDISLADRAQVRATIQAALADRQPYILEYPIVHADGGVRWIYEKGQGIFDGAGKLLWLDGVMFDISDRKQSETLLDSQKQVLEKIAAGAPLMETLTLLINAFEPLARCKAGSVLFLDPQGKRLHYGIAPSLPEDYIQSSDGLEIGPCAGSCGTAAFRRAPVIATDIFTDPLWVSGRDLARQYHLRSCWSMPILGSQGQIFGTLAFYYSRPQSPAPEDWQLLETAAHLAGIAIERKRTDEELYRAKEAAEAANRAKSQFLANMSHELRTPMNAILGFTQLMARDTTLSAQQHQSLSVINQSGEHLLSLINDVLEMSKIEAGRVVLNAVPFDLYGLLYSLHEMFQGRAATKHLSLSLDIASNVPQYVISDEGKLRQVLINLLGNAIKFTEVGSVSLRVSLGAPSSNRANGHPRHRLNFEVADTGPGIAPEVLPILFKPFVQARNHVPGEGGTGLGLAISRQFVQLMGGTITVETALGQGARFFFSIDVTLADPAAIPASAQGHVVQRLAPNQPDFRILVVDDRAENREPLSQLLQSVGFVTRTARNGQEAVAQWQRWQPHLIWMDMRMPLLDGYAATRQIRTLEQQRAVPRCKILAITASAFDDQRDEVFAAGCDDFVHKPFRVAIIFKKMADHIGVQYCYAEQPSPAPEPVLAPLQPQDLQEMPPAWLKQLNQAAIEADADWVRHLITQIPAAQAGLANQLMTLANQFDFDAMIELTEGIEHG